MFLSRARYCASAYLVTNLSACTYYQVNPQSLEVVRTAEEFKAKRRPAAFCEYVKNAKPSSAATLAYAGECVEQGILEENEKSAAAKDYYVKAASCGSSTAQEHLKRFKVEQPEAHYSTHRTKLMFDFGTNECGYEAHITTVGWILSPVAAVAAAGVAAVTLPLVTLLVFAPVISPLFSAISMGASSVGRPRY